MTRTTEDIKHCSFPPCLIPGCGNKCDPAGDCLHGSDDDVCQHEVVRCCGIPRWLCDCISPRDAQTEMLIKLAPSIFDELVTAERALSAGFPHSTSVARIRLFIDIVRNAE